MENGATSYWCLVSARSTMHQFMFCYTVFTTTTFRANKTIRLSNIKNVIPTILLISELNKEFLKMFGISLDIIHATNLQLFYLTERDRQQHIYVAHLLILQCILKNNQNTLSCRWANVSKQNKTFAITLYLKLKSMKIISWFSIQNL